MKKYAILYDWPVAQIAVLADSEVAEAYAATLPQGELDAFTKLTETMRGLGADLAVAKAARAHFGKWQLLGELLGEFARDFASFPDLEISKFRLSVLLAAKAWQTGAVLDEEHVDDKRFELRQLSSAMPLGWFAHENLQSPDDSLAIFNCADLLAVQAELDAGNVAPMFLFQQLAAIQACSTLPSGHAAIIKIGTPKIEDAAVDGFARLIVISAGKPVHLSHKYGSLPTIIDRDAIRAGVEYQQWADVIGVLSEYNSRDEVLIKYLTVYHVIENFMFKLPIVSLEREQAGRMFSIREFRRLYERVDMRELDALKDLFTAVLKLSARPGVTYAQHVKQRWNSLTVTATVAQIDLALGSLGLKVRHARFVNDAASNLAQLVYALRNAIVHNKETELHLTSASLDRTVSAIIENFLLPTLEEISFGIVGERNALLWYQQQNLLLYR